jgi:hypothetical protein
MAVSLLNANGDPVSSFGTGNSQFATGSHTNPFMTSPARTFGDLTNDRSANTPARMTATRAGSTTSLGYGDPAKSSSGRSDGGGGGGGGSRAASPSLVPDQQMGIPAAEAPESAQQKPEGTDSGDWDEEAGPPGALQVRVKGSGPPFRRSTGRNDSFTTGQNEGKPGGGMGGMAADAAMDAIEL